MKSARLFLRISLDRRALAFVARNVYIFVAEIESSKDVRQFSKSCQTYVPLAALLIIFCYSLCFLLARSITEPIRSLQRTRAADRKRRS